MKKLFLAWYEPVSCAWFPVGSLTYENDWYEFVYLKGAEEAKNKCGFTGVYPLNEFDKVYRSQELLPVFSHRIMRKSRPDYPEFISWQNLSETEDNPMILLSRSGGKKVTDNYEVFPYPEQDDNGVYHIYFFIQGVRYMVFEQLQVGEILYLMHDYIDPDDLMLRTQDFHLLGYCPRYISSLVKNHPDSVKVTLDKVNRPTAPLRMRLLCHLTIEHENFQPYSSPMYDNHPQGTAS